MAQVVGAGTPEGVSIPSRIIIFVWCFMILLLLTMYTGNAAAILTTSSISTDISCEETLLIRTAASFSFARAYAAFAAHFAGVSQPSPALHR